MKRRGSVQSSDGFTLIEVLIALTILALIIVNIHLVSKCGATAARSGAMMSSLENELELTLDRITFALMSAEDSEIEGPVPAPMPSSFVRFASVIGRDGEGNVLMSPTEQISWSAHNEVEAGSGGPKTGGGKKITNTARDQRVTREGGHVSWIEDADEATGRQITWSNAVPLAYKGEVSGNAEDDNGNDLLDEGGLAFARDGAQVQVFLTVERVDEKGVRRPVERSLRIAPRN
ncbi:MAG: prepilin-type N-terminal cleavage/methylation domain-containing protein [Planctomycetota bacterium]